MTNTEAAREIYVPSYTYVLGTGIRSNVARWEIVGRRVYVEYTDGLVAHSEHTPGEIRTGGFAIQADLVG
jgi:hypothetical protein